jgi:hypothetical protein
MLVATQPYGNTDFEYPEIVLNPFKASSVSIIPQSEALKAWEEQDKKEAEELEKEAEKEAKQAEKEADKLGTILANIEAYDGTSAGQKDVNG